MNFILHYLKLGVIRFSASLIFWALIVLPAKASLSPGWDDIPDALKKTIGFEQRGDWFYITAASPIIISESGKSHELSRKKSLLRSMQLLRLSLTCGDLVAGLSSNQQKDFFVSFAPIAPNISIQGLITIRQWEVDNTYYTTIAAPVHSETEYSCNFSRMTEAVDAYLDQGDVSLDGLVFSLSQVSHYSNQRKIINNAIGKWYIEHDLRVLARPFMKSDISEKNVTELDLINFQNQLNRAEKLTLEAKQLADKGHWQEALEKVSEALDLVPTYSPAYLILADYFLTKEQQPFLALRAAETSMRDGTFFNEALSKMIASLKKLDSDEVEVYKSIQDLVNKSNDKKYPETWNAELDIFKKVVVPSLVIRSGGNAITGESQLADLQFNQAVALFGTAKSDDEILMVLALLMSASEKQPYSAETYNLIGACYRNLGRPVMALPFLWQALKLKPDYDLALTNLALCCQELGLMKAAKYYIDSDSVRNSSNSWVQASYQKLQ